MICGNSIAKIEGQKIVGINLWQWHCQNRRKKKIVGMTVFSDKQEVKKQWKKCNLPWTNRFQFVHQQHWYVREWCMHNKQKVKKQWNPTILFFFSSISAMSLAQINGYFFFFFFKEMICVYHFYNIFTINPKWYVVIVGLKK